MNTGFLYWLVKLNSSTNFLAFFIGIALYRRFPREIKTLFYYVALGAVTDALSLLFVKYVMKSSMPFGHFYFPVAFFLVGWFYIQIFKGFIKPVYIIVIIIIYDIYSIINSLFIQSIFEYASLVGAIGAMLIFLFSVTYFIKVMVEGNIVKLAREPLIWINTAFLVYYAINFFYHSLYNLRLSASIDVAWMAVRFFSSLNLLFYLTIAIVFLFYGTKGQNFRRNKKNTFTFTKSLK
jgi:hypothetical protein